MQAPLPRTTTPSIAAWLGLGGLVPFLLLATAEWVDLRYGLFWRHALIAYGAVILSFVGALHWGFAMSLSHLSVQRRDRTFLWSVVPALAAWAALLLAPPLATPLLVLGFLAQYWQDRRLCARIVLPAWFLPLRLRLTTVACLSLAAGALASRYWTAL